MPGSASAVQPLDGSTALPNALAGKTTEASPTPFGTLTFDGRMYVPVVPGKNVIIAYVGLLTPIDDGVNAKYPALKTYPAPAIWGQGVTY